MYTIDRINRIRLTLGMTSLARFVKPMTAEEDVRALEVFCGIHPWIEVNIYKRSPLDYIGRRIHRLEVHCGIVPFDDTQDRDCPRHTSYHAAKSRAGADLSGAHTFWLGADAA